ncbi:unnamed protein product [Ectocarpus sp. 4 AP-2014]
MSKMTHSRLPAIELDGPSSCTDTRCSRPVAPLGPIDCFSYSEALQVAFLLSPLPLVEEKRFRNPSCGAHHSPQERRPMCKELPPYDISYRNAWILGTLDTQPLYQVPVFRVNLTDRHRQTTNHRTRSALSPKSKYPLIVISNGSLYPAGTTTSAKGIVCGEGGFMCVRCT